MMGDISKSVNPKKNGLVVALAIIFFVISMCVFYSNLKSYILRVNQEEVTYVRTTPQISNQEKISIMTKPSDLPVQNPNMTDAEKIKIMTGKK